MAWDFSTEPDFEEQLEWMRSVVKERIEPLETLDITAEERNRILEPLKDEVKERGLWAAHLPVELGGGGFGQVRLGLMHEILGRSFIAPPVFGVNAPDSGNSELLALGGTEEQKERWLYPLLDGEIRSAFSMTEPGAGSDPTLLTTRAVKDGDDWLITGHKWFTTNGSVADILIVMAVTDPDAKPHERCSMFVVPAGAPGVEIVRDVQTMAEPTHETGQVGGHAEIKYHEVRVPGDHLIGGPDAVGSGFALAQKRLGPGRIHHAMRWLGQSQRAFDMLCERALTRYTAGSVLADKQIIQDWIATSATEMHAARLLTLHAAWKMDQVGAKATRVEIAMIKWWGAKVLYDVIDRAIQVHGALGVTSDLPLEQMYRSARAARILDGPDEVHKVSIARRVLRNYKASEVPSEHVPTRREEAIAAFGDMLDAASLNS